MLQRAISITLLVNYYFTVSVIPSNSPDDSITNICRSSSVYRQSIFHMPQSM